MKKVVKFGGSSLASARQFQKMKEIIDSDHSRRFIVPSAPGKRDRFDTKITDLLYLCYDLISAGQNGRIVQAEICRRYKDIVQGLNLDYDLKSEFEKIDQDFKNRAGRDYAASRGEYLSGLIISRFLEVPFIDAAEIVCFDQDGNFLPERTNAQIQSKLSGLDRAVIPGFYGSLPDGTIKTFCRGGSDLTGALVARAVHADIYENWTDVSGLLTADPEIVPSPLPVEEITYQELHRLSCLGAQVFQEEAVYPVKRECIPIHIKNTNRPQDSGTRVVSDTSYVPALGFLGVTGRKQFCAIHLISSSIDHDIKEKAFSLLAENNISCDMIITKQGELTVWVSCETWAQKEHVLLPEFKKMIKNGCYATESGLALIAVGCRNRADKGTLMHAVKGTLRRMAVQVKGEDCDGLLPSILLGVKEDDYEKTIRAIYSRFTRRIGSNRLRQKQTKLSAHLQNA